MTYEELLAKISGVSIDVSNTFPQLVDDNLTPNVKALRAVVELHKPSNKGHDWMPLDLCEICVEDPGDYELARDVDYPCPTIQAIEKELNK